jgi:hypothetical protein
MLGVLYECNGKEQRKAAKDVQRRLDQRGRTAAKTLHFVLDQTAKKCWFQEGPARLLDALGSRTALLPRQTCAVLPLLLAEICAFFWIPSALLEFFGFQFAVAVNLACV